MFDPPRTIEPFLSQQGQKKALATYVLPWVARWLIFKPKIPIWANFGVCINVAIFYVKLLK
jgi:hypothetical protein